MSSLNLPGEYRTNREIPFPLLLAFLSLLLFLSLLIGK
nr:hypothetical protein Q903MT_gene4627 [Picea sitchensis]